jgi:hypothetical protein
MAAVHQNFASDFKLDMTRHLKGETTHTEIEPDYFPT